MFTPSFTPRGEHTLLFRRMEEQTENFIPRGLPHPQETKFTPREQNSSLGSKIAPRGIVKNGLLIFRSQLVQYIGDCELWVVRSNPASVYVGL
jgi:hypothetical protein